jgi:hypothetical protein
LHSTWETTLNNQKNSFLLLLGIIVIVSARMVYLFTAGKAALQQSDMTPIAAVPYSPQLELSQARPAEQCSSKQRDFQMGVAFPQFKSISFVPLELAEWERRSIHASARQAICSKKCVNGR